MHFNFNPKEAVKWSGISALIFIIQFYGQEISRDIRDLRDSVNSMKKEVQVRNERLDKIQKF